VVQALGPVGGNAMGAIFMMIAVLVAMSVLGTLGAIGSVFGSLSGIPVIVMIVAIVVFGGVLRELAKSSKNLSRNSRKDLDEIKQRISQMEADIADIKEQIADFIINQV
jgi:ABC-type multidrug transport system fused ATPase/permease subunit